MEGTAFCCERSAAELRPKPFSSISLLTREAASALWKACVLLAKLHRVVCVRVFSCVCVGTGVCVCQRIDAYRLAGCNHYYSIYIVLIISRASLLSLCEPALAAKSWFSP